MMFRHEQTPRNQKKVMTMTRNYLACKLLLNSKPSIHRLLTELLGQQISNPNLIGRKCVALTAIASNHTHLLDKPCELIPDSL